MLQRLKLLKIPFSFRSRHTLLKEDRQTDRQTDGHTQKSGVLQQIGSGQVDH
jgi:hypothetical protein